MTSQDNASPNADRLRVVLDVNPASPMPWNAKILEEFSIRTCSESMLWGPILQESGYLEHTEHPNHACCVGLALHTQGIPLAKLEGCPGVVDVEKQDTYGLTPSEQQIVDAWLRLEEVRPDAEDEKQLAKFWSDLTPFRREQQNILHDIYHVNDAYEYSYKERFVVLRYLFDKYLDIELVLKEAA